MSEKERTRGLVAGHKKACQGKDMSNPTCAYLHTARKNMVVFTPAQCGPMYSGFRSRVSLEEALQLFHAYV